MLKLITSPTSPFGRKAWITVLEKNIPCEIIFDIPWNENNLVTANNPLGKVPILLTESGQNIFDSRVIVEYLDTLPSQNAPLLPLDIETRIAVKRLEALADGLTDALLNLFLEFNKRTPETRSAWWIERQQGKLFNALQALSDELGEKTYYVGERLSLADISVICSLGYLDLRFTDIDWRTRHPHLATFAARMNAFPHFEASLPKA